MTRGDRLVTLVGPGGVGKTRLAIEAARRVGGTSLTAHASLRWPPSRPRDLASAIARALARAGPGGRASHRPLLRRFLTEPPPAARARQTSSSWSRARGWSPTCLGPARELTVLVTSREPTRLAAERADPVRPLEVPDCRRTPAACFERYGAVAMFCDRARARDLAFALDLSTALPASRLCRRLDGLPFALELAAARVGLLCAADLAERLENTLALLVGGARDAPERQRTLRATIDWSYRLLSDAERQAFARMAVFESGFTDDSSRLRPITGASLDTLGALVDKQPARSPRPPLSPRSTRSADTRSNGSLRVPRPIRSRDRFAGWCLRFVRDAATPQLGSSPIALQLGSQA